MKNKKLLIAGASAASLAALGLGAFALFSDEARLNPLTTKVGTVEVEGSVDITHTQMKRNYAALLMAPENTVNPTAVWGDDNVGADEEISEAKAQMLSLFETAPDNLNPGDNELPTGNTVPGTDHEIVINVENKGTKSIQTRVLIELTGADENGNALTTADLQKINVYFDQYNSISGFTSVPQLSADILEARSLLRRMTTTKNNAIVYVADYVLVNNSIDLSVLPEAESFTDSMSDYVLSGLILSGTGENAETELFETFDILNEEYVSRTAPTSGTIKLDLGLDADAGEFFEGKTIEVKVTVQALQLRNSSSSNWSDMFSERYIF
jgi:hypothetical protein